MNDILTQFITYAIVNTILLLITTFCFNKFLDMQDIKKQNKKLNDINIKFNNTIIKQYKEIERLNSIIEEYRKIIKKIN